MVDLKKVREIVNEHLKLTVGDIIEDNSKITGANRTKARIGGAERWKVNVLYTPKATNEDTKARFTIDAESGEVELFEMGVHFSL